MANVKRPAFQFYPGDWLRSADLRACSVGARGLWIDMLCLMHGGNPYGYLRVGATVIHSENLARMVGAEATEIEKWLEELALAEVYSIDKNGVIFSRRMVRDERRRAVCASAGKKGGNPSLLNRGVNPTANNPVNPHDKDWLNRPVNLPDNQTDKRNPTAAFAVAVKTIRSTTTNNESGEDYPQDSKPNGGQAPGTPTATPNHSGEKWWLTVQGIAQKGIELGIPPTYREEARDYKRRLFVEIEARRKLAESKPEGK